MQYLIDTLGKWGASAAVILGVTIVFLLMQLTGEIIEWMGKVSPKILKLRKVFQEHKAMKKRKEEQLAKLDTIDTLLTEVNNTLTEFNKHYSADNIAKRDSWIDEVNQNIKWTRSRADVYDQSIKELSDLKLAANKMAEFNCKQIKESYRNRILDFQHRIINSKNKPEPERFSHEEFAKIYATYNDYEEFLLYTNDTNHQVDNAMETINKAENGELPDCYNIEFID